MKAEATKRAIATATRVASNDNDDGNGGKSNGNGNKGAGQATTRAMVAATTAAGDNEGNSMAMRVASNKEGKGSKAMETVTRVAGKQRQWQ